MDEGSGVTPLYRSASVSVRPADLRARVRAWPPLRLDLALAAIVLVEALVEAAFADVSWPARLAVAGPAALVAAGVALRRVDALGAMVLAAAGVAATTLLAADVERRAGGIVVAWLFVAYTMASREEGRRLAAGVAVCLAAPAVLALSPEVTPLRDAGFAMLLVGAPLFAGRMLRSRVRLGEALATKAEQLDRERARRADEAASEERARIAGELHDVVAHALGAMTIQAAAARRLAGADDARAGGALEAIERTGRDALGEIRTLLEILRGDPAEDHPDLAPQPSLAGLSELVERTRRAGLPVRLEVDGVAPEAVPAGIDLAAYRVVQEALEEALEAGGARTARVVVRYRDDVVELEIHDDGTAPSRALLGLQERVRVCRGRVETGSPDGSGHCVRACLPLEGISA
jgi:signal transduction histidine kinase